MPVLRVVDGEKRILLSLHGVRQHEWLLIVAFLQATHAAHRAFISIETQ